MVWGIWGGSGVKNSRLDLDDVELMADPEAALEVDPDILDEIARRKMAGAEEAVQVLNREETENEYSGLELWIRRISSGKVTGFR